MKTRSEMFLNNVTAIDFAYIDDTGMIIGGSLSPMFHISGDLDEQEQVVVDFSTVKKVMKEVIDGQENGFDHKLWVIKNFSQAEIVNSIYGDRLSVLTPLLSVSMPKNAYKLMTADEFDGTNVFVTAERCIEDEVENELRKLYPDADIEVTLKLMHQFVSNEMGNTDLAPFRYVHGLKDSTSWGCQNIAHGHMSYISATASDPIKAGMLVQKIAAELDNTIFIKEENLGFIDNQVCEIRYFSGRGLFNMHLSHENENLKTMVIKAETTVENLVDFVAYRWEDELIAAGVSVLYVSEGLNKGAVFRF